MPFLKEKFYIQVDCLLFLTMDKVEDSIKNQIAALWRVINVTRSFKEDNLPCQIEEVIMLGCLIIQYIIHAFFLDFLV